MHEARPSWGSADPQSGGIIPCPYSQRPPCLPPLLLPCVVASLSWPLLETVSGAGSAGHGRGEGRPAENREAVGTVFHLPCVGRAG